MRKCLIAAALLAAACQGGGEGGNDAATPAGNEATQAGSPAAGKAEAGKATLLQALEQSAEHKTLANAVKAAGLTETLSGAQPYTLFAPSDAAFQKLPAGQASGLLAPEAKGRLVGLLTAHIVPGVVTAEDLGRAIERGKGKAQLATVGGTSLSFGRSGDAIVVSDGGGAEARIVGAGTAQSNGVVHSVDSVLAAR